MQDNLIIENCKPPYIDAETLRIKAEETWPQWKIDLYNENIATTAHARKLHAIEKKMTNEEIENLFCYPTPNTVKGYLITKKERYNQKPLIPLNQRPSKSGNIIWMASKDLSKIRKYAQEHNATIQSGRPPKLIMPDGEIFSICVPPYEGLGARSYHTIIDEDIKWDDLNFIFSCCISPLGAYIEII